MGPKNISIRCQRELATHVARVQGEQSAAAIALQEFHARGSRGEQVVLFPLRGRWLVETPDAILLAVRQATSRTV